MIRKADVKEYDIITKLVKETIEMVYPKYYLAGAVDFFLSIHTRERIASEIEAGRVFVVEENGAIKGTVTIDSNEIARLFVSPTEQGKGYGRKLLDFAEKTIFGYSEAIRLASSLPAKEIYLKRGYAEKEYHKIRTDNGDFLCYDVMEKQNSGE